MEKDIGKIKKNDITDIVIRVDDFGGRVGLTIREFTTSDRYTGFTKSGTRIPAESFADFKAMINSIDKSDLVISSSEPVKRVEKKKKAQKTLEEDSVEEDSESSEDAGEDIKEEVF